MYKNNDKQIEERINNELKKHNMAYKIKDREGNIFVYGGIESNIPWYRGMRGSKHIDSLIGFEIIQQYCEL